MKSEEDLYVIDKNLGDSIFLMKQIKRLNSWNNYLNLLRTMSCITLEKYQTVFQYEDKSDFIYIILKGQVGILLPDCNFERDRYSVELKRRSAKQLHQIVSKHPQLEYLLKGEGVDTKNNDFQSVCNYLEQNFLNEKSTQLSNIDANQQPWGSDEAIIQLLHPGMFLSNTIGECKSFGEIGVEFLVPRSSTVVCLSQCELAAIPSRFYNSLYNKKFRNEDKYCPRLRNINGLFKFLSKDRLTHFARHMEVQTYTQGQVIFEVGEDPEWIYFIERGEVIIQQKFHILDLKPPSNQWRLNFNGISQMQTNQPTFNDFQYQLVTVAILGEGSYFGEDGVYFQRQEAKRITTAVSKDQSIIFKIQSNFFYNNLKALLEGEGLSPSKIKNKLQAMVCDDEYNEKEKVEEEDGGSINHDNSKGIQVSKAFVLHEHAKQSLKGKKVYEKIEDDFLNVRGLKKDLFTLYEEEKFKLKNGSSSSIQFPQSQELISNEEYLYPKYDISLNPNLFVRKGYKRRIEKPSNSRRSSTYMLGITSSERFVTSMQQIEGMEQGKSSQHIQPISNSLISSAQKNSRQIKTQNTVSYFPQQSLHLTNTPASFKKPSSSSHLRINSLQEEKGQLNLFQNLKEIVPDCIPITLNKISQISSNVHEESPAINSFKSESTVLPPSSDKFANIPNREISQMGKKTCLVRRTKMLLHSKTQFADPSSNEGESRLYSITRSFKEFNHNQSQIIESNDIPSPHKSQYNNNQTPIMQQNLSTNSRQNSPSLKISISPSSQKHAPRSIMSRNSKYEKEKKTLPFELGKNLNGSQSKIATSQFNHSKSIGMSSMELINLECNEQAEETKQKYKSNIDQQIQCKKKYGIDSKSILKGQLKFLVDAQDSLHQPTKLALQQSSGKKEIIRLPSKFDISSKNIMSSLQIKLAELLKKQKCIPNNSSSTSIQKSEFFSVNKDSSLSHIPPYSISLNKQRSEKLKEPAHLNLGDSYFSIMHSSQDNNILADHKKGYFSGKIDLN